MRQPPSWKIENRLYLRNGSTDLREIWYDDAYWASEWDRKLKFPTFENPRWRTAAILKNWKIAISQPRFDRFWQNSARRRSSILLSVAIVKNLKLPKIQDGGIRHLEKWKIGYISGTVRPIFAKFGTVMHIGPPNWTGSWNLQLLKIQNGERPPSWKIEKSPYVSPDLSDFDKIWHVDAVRTCWASEPLKIWNFQNPRWRRPPSWKIENRP